MIGVYMELCLNSSYLPSIYMNILSICIYIYTLAIYTRYIPCLVYIYIYIYTSDTVAELVDCRTPGHLKKQGLTQLILVASWPGTWHY